MTSYCEYVRQHPEDLLNRAYHDAEYGFPLVDDSSLLERLALEINQAGLRWSLILQRREAFRRAFAGFSPDILGAFSEQDITRLMADVGIIRNQRKIRAVVENARRVRLLVETYGSFKVWLDSNSGMTLEAWTRLFKATFVFTGTEIVREFLVSTGYLPGAHEEDCPAYARIKKQKPAWARLPVLPER
jgi:DNA-3-methyladenine glycosylase I